MLGEKKSNDLRSISLDDLDDDFDQLGINPDSINLEPKLKDKATYSLSRRKSSGQFQTTAGRSKTASGGIDGERMTAAPPNETSFTKPNNLLINDQNETELTPRRRALSMVEQARDPSVASCGLSNKPDNSQDSDLFS